MHQESFINTKKDQQELTINNKMKLLKVIIGYNGVTTEEMNYIEK